MEDSCCIFILIYIFFLPYRILLGHLNWADIVHHDWLKEVIIRYSGVYWSFYPCKS